MFVYLANICLLILYGGFFLRYKPTQCSKKIFCFMATLNWICISGFRHFTVGADTYGYKILNFDVIKFKPWKNIIEDFVDILFKGAPGKDPGYQIFIKIVQIFITNYQVYLVIIAFIFMVPLGIWIYRNSSEPLISFLVFSCFFYSFFAITGLRQTISTSFVVLIGYKFIKKRKIVPFLVLVLIAFTIHKSAIIFFPFYFIVNKKITKGYLIIVSVILPFIYVFRKQVIYIMANLSTYSGYADPYESEVWTFSSIMLILAILTFWRHEIIIRNNPKAVHYINALIISLVFVPLNFYNNAAMRGMQYFSLFLMLLIPEIINSFNEKEKRIIYYSAAFLMILLFAKNNPQYLFFWQG